MSRLASTKSLVRSLVTSEPDPRWQEDHDDSPGSPQERIKRVAVKTMDLGRSFTGRPRSPTGLTLHPGPTRSLYLKRKDKGKEAQTSQDEGQGDYFRKNAPRTFSSLLNPLKAIITLSCHRSPTTHKSWNAYPHKALLRLSRMIVTHPSLPLHRRPWHPHSPCCSL